MKNLSTNKKKEKMPRHTKASTCFYCHREFTLDERVPFWDAIRRVVIDGEILGICCPECEFDKLFKS